MRSVDFTEVSTPEEVEAAFETCVQAGAEGVVLRCADGRAFKIKPRVAIDAAVVAYTETPSGVGELLLGLIPDEQDGEVRQLQLIGRVDTGFSRQERRALADLLKPLRCDSSLHITSRGGHPYCWVRPVIVVETACHEVLTVNSGEPVRRWRIQHADDNWQPLGKSYSVSLRDAVFVRVREDKTVALPDVRWGEVGAFARVETATAAPPELPASSILGRFENGRVIQHKRSPFLHHFHQKRSTTAFSCRCKSCAINSSIVFIVPPSKYGGEGTFS